MNRLLPRSLLLLAVLCLTCARSGNLAAQEPKQPGSLQLLTALEDVLSDAIARNEKSVVAIASMKRVPVGEGNNQPFPDPFNRLQSNFVDRSSPDYIPGPEEIPNDFATGIVIDSRGLILTNYHVLGEDRRHFVTTHERKTYRTRIKGADPRSDLAVLEIVGAPSPLNLTPIKFGNASTLRKGHFVIALGNPYAIARDGQASAAWGIVSNLARKAGPVSDERTSAKPTLHHFGTLIQTDAKLNFGTSGGDLLNLKGEMVGLTTSLAALAGFEQAAGYAIPVDDTLLRVVETLKEGKEVEYGFLGIQPENLPPSELLGDQHGIRILGVVPGSPADISGLTRQDLVIAVDGQAIHDIDGLFLHIGKLPVDSQPQLTVLHNGALRTITIDPLSKYPVQGKKIVTTPAPAWRGMRVDYATAVLDQDALKNREFLRDGNVAVAEVEEGSPAAKAGLQRGTVISHVGSTPVRSPKAFFDAVAGKTAAIDLRLVDRPDGAFAVPNGLLDLSPKRTSRPVRTIEPESGS